MLGLHLCYANAQMKALEPLCFLRNMVSHLRWGEAQWYQLPLELKCLATFPFSPFFRSWHCRQALPYIMSPVNLRRMWYKLCILPHLVTHSPQMSHSRTLGC